MNDYKIKCIDERGPYITTYTGKKFHACAPWQREICLKDIAHSLSQNCRFNGHCDDFYSVAEHCIHVSNFVPKQYALWGLLHDASEAYVPDIPAPFKSDLTNFREQEDRILQKILEKYGLEMPEPEEVHKVDKLIAGLEGRDLFKKPPEWVELYDLSMFGDFKITKPMSPREAELAYIYRFKELTEEEEI